MLWIKALHIVFMVTWFAGLFYLPRLFVYHTLALSDGADARSLERFKVMERKLFYGITTPGGVLTIIFGLWLWLGYGFAGGWLVAKLLLVLVLVAYHILCGKYVRDFKYDKNQYGHVYYRWFNEFPVLLMVLIIILVVVKPF